MVNRSPVPLTRHQLIGCFFAGAMVLAPFLALILGVNYGIGMMALALGVTAFLSIDTARTADPRQRQRLAVLAGLNVVLAALLLVALIVRGT